MLKITVLNVGKGDSILLEYRGKGDASYGVIDSHRDGADIPPALRRLQEVGARRLSFVALTHPHADHYDGLVDLFRAYPGLIDTFITFPLDSFAHGRLKQLATKLKEVAVKHTDSNTARATLLQLLALLVSANDARKNGTLDWIEPAGPFSRIYVNGFDHVDIYALLPLRLYKGFFFQALKAPSIDIVEHKELNNLSLGFWLRYGGTEVILGGDAVRDNWTKHANQLSKVGQTLNARAVKVPHHGSKHDNDQTVVQHLFGNDPSRIAIISADGHRHPHSEILKLLASNDIKPYCTNLADQCGANIRELVRGSGLSPVFLRFLNSVATEPGATYRQPCQGHVEISITPKGQISVSTQKNNACPYRGDYDFLGST